MSDSGIGTEIRGTLILIALLVGSAAAFLLAIYGPYAEATVEERAREARIGVACKNYPVGIHVDPFIEDVCAPYGR